MKMNLKHRVLSIILALVMVLSIAPVAIFAEDAGSSVATVNGTGYDTLADAIAAAVAGEDKTVVLTDNTEVDNYVLDAVGITIKSNGDTQYEIKGIKSIAGTNVTLENVYLNLTGTLEIGGTNTTLTNCYIRAKDLTYNYAWDNYSFDEETYNKDPYAYLTKVTGKKVTLTGVTFDGTAKVTDDSTNSYFAYLCHAKVTGEDVTMEGCTFYEGTYACGNSSPKGTWTLDGCKFSRIYHDPIEVVDSANDPKVIVNDCDLVGCSDFNDPEATVIFTNCRFGKTADHDAAYYGVYCYSKNVSFTDCSFTSDYIRNDDDKVKFFNGIYFGNNVTVEMSDCTLAGSTDGLAELCRKETNNITGLVAIDAVKDADGKYISGTFVGSASAVEAKLAEGATYDSTTGKVTCDYVAKIGDTGYATLAEAIAAAADGDTITLVEGEFTTYGNTSPKKSLTFVGAGKKTVWTIGDLTKNVGSESNGDYSFDGCDTITFKNMTLKADNANYRGFIRINNTVVEGCILEGRTAYWGYNTAKFTKSVFNAPEGDYALWDYSTKVMTFDGCEFNISGKGVNVYVEAGNAGSDTRKVEVKDCTVTSTKANKAFLNIKNKTQAYEVTISGTNVITGLNADATTDSNLYQVEATEITETSGKTVKVQEKAADGTVTTVYEVKVPSAAVAKIGNTEYETLAEAIAAAKDGDTVKLLQNCSGDGIAIAVGKFPTSGLTIDFGGFTYNVDGTTVGSPNTQTNGFQLLVGNKITMKNGTIYSDKAYILIQNYSNLTLDGMKLDGKDIPVHPTYPTTVRYTLSNNCGETVIKDSEITAPATRGIAFDVCGYSSYTGVSVTVKGASVINGNIEISRSSNNANGVALVLESGTINGELKVDKSIADSSATTTITKSTNVTLTAPSGYKWAEDGSLAKIDYVAEIDGVQYETIQAAIDAAKSNDTIKLLKNVDLGDGKLSTYDVKSTVTNVTIDLGGYTLTSAGQYTVYLRVNNWTIQNGTIVNTSTSTTYGTLYIGGTYNSTTLKNVTVESETNGVYFAIASSKNGIETSITVEDGTKISGNYGVYMKGQPKPYNATRDGQEILNVNGGEITGKIAAIAVFGAAKGNTKAGVIVNINGGKVYSDGYAIAGNGSPALENTTINISGGEVISTKDVAIYHPQAGTVTITGGTVSGVTGGVQMCSGTLNVTGGTIVATGGGDVSGKTGDGSIPDGAAVSIVNRGYSGGTPAADIAGGTFTAKDGNAAIKAYDWADNTEKDFTASENVSVSGGKFSSAVSEELCADGFIPTKNADGTYGVKSGAYVAAIGDTKYATLAEAIAAAKSGDTITLLADITNTDYTVANVINIALASGVTLDGNGHTLSGNVEITVASEGGVTIKNVNFKDIHNDAVVSDAYKTKYGFSDDKVGTLSAIYASALTGTLEITGCTFENADWEAMQITPAEGADITITDNIFKTSESETVKEQLRHIHVEMAYGTGFDYEGTDIKLTITDNQLLGGTKEADLGVWWVGKASDLALSGNYYADPDAVSITLSDKSFNRENRCDLIYPARSAADVDEDNLTKVAMVIKDAFNVATYDSLVKALEDAKTGETVKLLSDVTIEGTSGLSAGVRTGVTLDLNGHSITGESVSIKNASNRAALTLRIGCNSKYVGEFVLTNSGTEGGITAQLPLEFYCDNDAESTGITVGDNVKLNVLAGGENAIYMNSTIYVVATATTKAFYKNGGFMVTVDNEDRIYETLGGAQSKNNYVTLLGNYTTTSALSVWGDWGAFTLDLGGHIYESTSSNIGNMFDLKGSTNITIKNGTLKGCSNSVIGLATNGNTLTLDNVTIETTGTYGISTSGENTNNTVTITNSTINAPNGMGIYFPSTGTLTIDGGTIEANTGVQVCAGSLVIKGAPTITATGDGTGTIGSGSILDGAAISIVSRSGYGTIESVEIAGGTFTAADGVDAVKVYAVVDGAAAEWADASSKVNITGGTFSTNVNTAWCAIGFEPVATDGKYTVKRTYVRVTVTSDPENSGKLTGGNDRYELKKEFTITASAVNGYTFIGWYLDGKLVTESTTWTYVASESDPGELNYVAKYKGNVDQTLSINVGTGYVERYDENGNKVAQWESNLTNNKFAKGTYFKVKAVALNGYTFLYWVNANNRVVSDDAEYSFYLGENTTLTACYKSNNERYVVIRDKNDKVLWSGAVTLDKTDAEGILYGLVEVPASITFAGFKFDKWVDASTNTEMTIITGDDNKSYFKVTADVTIKALYTRDTDTKYTVVVDGGTGSGEYTYGEIVEIEAPETNGELKFAGWYVGDVLISYNNKYSLYVTGKVTLTAKYAEKAPTKTPIVGMTMSDRVKDTTTGKQSVVMNVTWSVPDGYTLVGAGLLITQNSELISGNKFNLDNDTNSDIRKYTTKVTTADGRYTFTMSMGATSQTKSLYAIGYLTFRNDATGEIATIYSGPIESPVQ